MEKKYYLVRFFKRIDKTNPIELYAFNYLKKKLTIWAEDNEYLYVQFKSGNIGFRDVSYGYPISKHLPLVVRKTEDGYVDIYNGSNIEIVYPFILCEIPEEEALNYDKFRDRDELSKLNVKQGTYEFIRIVNKYTEYCQSLTSPVTFDKTNAKESFVRSRNK